MAKPINPTPILFGEDRRLFLKDLNSQKFNPSKEKFLKECDSIFKQIKKKV